MVANPKPEHRPRYKLKDSSQTPSQTITALTKDEQGQSLVEFALAVPILLLMLIGIVNFGMIMFIYLNLNITAQETSRLAGLGDTDSNIIQYARDHASVKTPDLVQVDILPNESLRKPGDYVTITLKYSPQDLTPIFDQFLSAITLTAKSTVRVE